MMHYVILLLAVLLLCSGVLLFLQPSTVFNLMDSLSDSIILYLLAVAVRVLLGVLLIVYAVESNYPVALQVIGWISIVAAVSIAVMGAARFKQLIKWMLRFTPIFARAGGLLAIAFGGFLVCATV